MGTILKMGDRNVGESSPTYIIAEMSANHAGELQHAIDIIHAAKESGADCIKIQTYTPDTLTINCDKSYFRVGKGTWEGENLYSLYSKAYTPWEWQAQLKEEAEKLGLHFLSTPFDVTAVDFLEELNVEAYKIASFEIVDIPLVKYIAKKKKPIILSTGMASLSEIDLAIKTIKIEGNNQICLLKCSSAYPAVTNDMNIKTMSHMRQVFNLPVGLSDHSMGSIGAITAVANGASVIEKHFCISREIENPDASFSMEPHEFKKMVDDVREVEKALGQISYELSEREEASRVFRKSIFIVKNIGKGEAFTTENIRVIRPGYGLAPKYYDEILGKKSTANLEMGEPLKWNHIY